MYSRAVDLCTHVLTFKGCGRLRRPLAFFQAVPYLLVIRAILFLFLQASLPAWTRTAVPPAGCGGHPAPGTATRTTPC